MYIEVAIIKVWTFNKIYWGVEGRWHATPPLTSKKKDIHLGGNSRNIKKKTKENAVSDKQGGALREMGEDS